MAKRRPPDGLERHGPGPCFRPQLHRPAAQLGRSHRPSTGRVELHRTQDLRGPRPSRPVPAKTELIHWTDFIESITNVYTKKFFDLNIVLRTEIEAKSVRFDPGHLRQIVTNLIDNSISAIKNEGQIQITIKNNHLSVSDTGPGIQQEKVEKIFEPFYTTADEGTGLGLAICRKLCIENGAEISVENNIQKGCTFKITFGVN